MASKNSDVEQGPVCTEGAKILYAWAMDATMLHLPKGIATIIAMYLGITILIAMYLGITILIAIY